MRALLLVGWVTLLGGCGFVSDYLRGEDNADPPAELVDFEPLTQVEEIWSRQVGNGTDEQYIKLTPAVDSQRVFAASSNGDVLAMDAATGQLVWETETDLPVTGGVGAGEGLVLVGTSEGDVVALDFDTGEQIWRTPLSSEVLTAPQIESDVVVVRTGDGKLFGLSAVNGEQLWVYDRTVPALTLRGNSGPTLERGLAVSGFDSGRLVAVSVADGQPLWETRVALPSGRSELERMIDIDARPLIARGLVYVVTFQGGMAAIDLETGEVEWRRDMSSYAGLGIDSEYLYVSDDQGHVWALDRVNSASVWRQDKLHARAVSAPASVSGFVVVGDFEGYVHWLRRDDGQFAARTRAGSERILAPPVTSDDTVFVYNIDGTLTAFRIP